ncbi:NAD(P)-dependent alcohol dehydrogenase [Hoeflea prorocentri]|uniref:NAD(P)-dependent alcohol dehydrogenase n=1 Tax=Hoeflea prorocentri TaxID=1922333 RepID=A0A9X3ZIM8_9HYPH|nr:NAD(P)-dependent alcohol dehydrogenase [Hoeflea prorocentri]MCY6382006.1 NAD(P)-dependent alcohol dehydrogenase [Hoeflea prorocentri]MDA5399806.1 NAD(P)-dependent alcohol dehydrogenase [Hoeflea prorocentri]
MKAIIYEEYGPPEVLQLRNVEAPKPADDDVLIRVRAAEATKADCELRGFRFSVKWFWLPLRIALGITKPRRAILGGYFAGEVAAVGTNVAQFSVGDKLFGTAGLHMGAYGEYVVLPATLAMAEKPRNMTFAQAAAVPLGGLNALHFMRLARLTAGEKILINGAGGSIGAHAVQIARSMGAEVTAVDKAAKEPMLRRLGVDNFVDYQREDFAQAGPQYDVVFDMVPTSSYRACISVLSPGGRYLCGNPRLSVMLRALLTNRFTDKSASFAFAKETREELEALRKMIEDGKIISIVDRELPMDQASKAHRLVETEERCGAIVLLIGT